LIETNTIVKSSLSVSTDNNSELSGSFNAKHNNNDEEESTIEFTNVNVIDNYNFMCPSSTIVPSKFIKTETHIDD
jgi:hypothetical protein